MLQSFSIAKFTPKQHQNCDTFIGKIPSAEYQERICQFSCFFFNSKTQFYLFFFFRLNQNFGRNWFGLLLLLIFWFCFHYIKIYLDMFINFCVFLCYYKCCCCCCFSFVLKCMAARPEIVFICFERCYSCFILIICCCFCFNRKKFYCNISIRMSFSTKISLTLI